MLILSIHALTSLNCSALILLILSIHAVTSLNCSECSDFAFKVLWTNIFECKGVWPRTYTPQHSRSLALICAKMQILMHALDLQGSRTPDFAPAESNCHEHVSSQAMSQQASANACWQVCAIACAFSFFRCVDLPCSRQLRHNEPEQVHAGRYVHEPMLSFFVRLVKVCVLQLASFVFLKRILIFLRLSPSSDEILKAIYWCRRDFER